MNGDVINQIGEQEVERKEGCRQKEVIQCVEVNVADGSDHEHEKEEEKQRDRCEIADLSGQRPGLQFLGHGHADLKS